MRKILNGLLALLLTGGILLISDLSNRVDKTSLDKTFIEKAELTAKEGKTYKMGLTYFAPEASFDLFSDGLWKGLHELGYVKDSNLTVIAQHANGEMANLQSIHLNMDNQDVDMILVTSTPGISAALSTVKNHPMVFSYSFTPLEAGAGKSFTNHLPNITGVGSFPPVEKTIDFIREIIPNTKRIGTLYNSSESNSRKVVEVAREYTEELGIKLIENTIINSAEVYQAISSLCMRNVDAVWITGDNTALQAFQSIVKACNLNNMPLIINDVGYIDQGALAAVGIGWAETGYHTANFVARILNGENPARIPIENYVDEKIVTNPIKAAQLNITFPEKYLNPSNYKLKGKKYKFCLAHYVQSPNSENAEQGIRDELKKSGLEEGPDFTLKTFNAQGDISTLNSITDAISSEKWDIIFVSSTPTIQSISKKVSDGSIVFTNVGDPIYSGLGESFTHHIANITGVSTMSDFNGLLKMVVESMPGIKTVGTIYCPGESNSVAYKEKLDQEAQKLGLSLIAVPANSATEVADAALSIANRGIEAFTQISDNLTASSGSSILKIAYKTKIPYFAFVENQVEQGAVAAVSHSYYDAGADAASMAIEILKGTSPKDIPYRFVTKSTVTINTEAVDYFNVKIPENYYQQEPNN
jgi:ABC-type uncharacterized transport system substrate-binding protein